MQISLLLDIFPGVGHLGQTVAHVLLIGIIYAFLGNRSDSINKSRYSLPAYLTMNLPLSLLSSLSCLAQ